MPHIPELIRQIQQHFGLSKEDINYIKEIQEKYMKESDRSLEMTIEANKQHVVHALKMTREVQIKMVVLEDILRTRKKLRGEKK